MLYCLIVWHSFAYPTLSHSVGGTWQALEMAVLILIVNAWRFPPCNTTYCTVKTDSISTLLVSTIAPLGLLSRTRYKRLVISGRTSTSPASYASANAIPGSSKLLQRKLSWKWQLTGSRDSRGIATTLDGPWFHGFQGSLTIPSAIIRNHNAQIK